ncbi:MAG: NUDIX hydrolase [Chloroflexi bacterium]|nr:NUDIX hydrolase [Chloroflexota bacterium]MDA1219055.1 NUDIX hydrolase [Chloroflexota bacterium]
MSDESLREITLESKTMFQGKILNLRVDTVRLPNGRVATREVAEHSNSVCIVPIDHNGDVVLVRQYRTPVKGALLELPAGGVEEGEVSEETVQRELQEEIGYRAGKLQHLSNFWLAPGWCDEYMHTYLATDLIESKLVGDDDENIVVERVSLDRALELIGNGEIEDVKSIAGLLLAMRVLRDN